MVYKYLYFREYISKDLNNSVFREIHGFEVEGK